MLTIITYFLPLLGAELYYEYIVPNRICGLGIMIMIVAYKTNYTSVLNAAQPICYIHSLVFEYLRGHQIHVVPLFSLQDNQKSIIESYFFSWGMCLMLISFDNEA